MFDSAIPFLSSIATLLLSGFFIELMWCLFLRTEFGLKTFADVPNSRSSHTAIVPRSAGAMFAIVLSLSLLFCPGENIAHSWASAAFGAFGYILLGTVGLIDDKFNLSAKIRFASHLISTLAIATSFLISKPDLFSVFSNVEIIVAIALWTFVSLASINFFNFADGINGLVGLAALIPTAFVVLVGESSFSFLWPMACAFLGALFCFLYFNFVRRTVFMGDSGSTVVGLWHAHFTLAVFYEFSNFSDSGESVSPIAAMMVAVLFAIAMTFWIFADCASMVIAKICLKMPLSMPHRQHSYQRLSRQAGWGHRRASSAIFVAQFALALIFIRVKNFSLGSLNFELLAATLAAALLTLATVFLKVNFAALKQQVKNSKEAI